MVNPSSPTEKINNENNRMLFWVAIVFVIGTIPIWLRLFIYALVPCVKEDASMINSLDITFAGLAFNWSNINESLNLTFSKKRKKISNTTSIIYLLVSTALVLFLGIMLGVIFYVEISKFTEGETIEKSFLLVSGFITFVSLLLNYTLIRKLKLADL